MMLGNDLLIWRRVWDRRVDPEYEIDCQHERILRDWVSDGRPVTEDSVEGLSAAAGRPLPVSQSSFKRLIEFGVLKPKRFSPPAPTVYRLTNKHPRRLPLGGKRMRAPREGGAWGRPPGSWAGSSADYSYAVQSVRSSAWTHRDRHFSLDAVDDRSHDEFDIDEFTSGLHPSVAQLCRLLAEGHEKDDAARMAGLSDGEMAVVWPKLRLAVAEAIAA